MSTPTYCAFHVLVRTKFRRYYCYSNSPGSFQRFRRTLRRNYKWIRQQMKNFPIDIHCKIHWLSATSSYVFNVKSGQWGSMRKIFICCLIQLKFRPRVRLKRWIDRGEFEFHWAKSKYYRRKCFCTGTHSTVKSLKRWKLDTYMGLD